MNLSFPDFFRLFLKLAGIISILEKKSVLNKASYRPVSLLSNISKIFIRWMNRHISIYLETIQYGFRKGNSLYDFLLATVEASKKIDHGKEYSAFLTTPSKAFDLVIRKLHAHGFCVEFRI